MELLLLFKLIEKLDGLTQKSIGRVIGDFERFLEDPAAFLARETVVIGPRKRYLLRVLLGLLLGYVGVMVIALTAIIVADVAGIAVPPALAQAGGPLLLLLFFVFFVAVFRHFRGGRAVLTSRGIELHYRGESVFCAWNLFRTPGQPHLLPGKDLLLVPIAPTAVRSVAHFKSANDEVHARGLAISTRHWKFQGPHQAVLKPIYEVNPIEFGKFLLGLGQLLGGHCADDSSAATEPATIEETPWAESPAANSELPLALPGDKGWIVLHLTRMTFPPYCCACLSFTSSTHPFKSKSSLSTEGIIKIPVPVCYGCLSRSQSRRWKAALLGMGGALALGVLLCAVVGLANPQLDLTKFGVIVVLAALIFGAFLGQQLLHHRLVRFRYHPSQGTVSARFRNPEYADYLLSLRLQGAEAS